MAQGEHAERAPLLWGASTDVGPVRSHNEDSWLAVSPVFAVADGMGGHLGGARASAQAVLTLQEFLSPDRLGDRPVDLSICPSRLTQPPRTWPPWHLLTIR